MAAIAAQLAIAGWLVDKWISGGRDAVRIRKIVLTVSMLISLSVVGAAFTKSIGCALTFLSIGAAGLAVSAPTGQSIVALIAPDGAAAKLGGIVNFVANLIGILAPIVTGMIVQSTGNFAWAFITAGLGIAIGIVSYTFILGRIEKIPGPPRSDAGNGSFLLDKPDTVSS